MNRFIEATHQYFNGAIEYISNSKFMEMFTGGFDDSKKNMIAHASAKGKNNVHNLTKNDFLNVLDLKNGIACNWGDCIHDSVHLRLTYKQMPKQPYLFYVVEKFIDQFGDDWISEDKIWTDEYEIGATLDMHKMVNGTLIVGDIKTNNIMDKTSRGKMAKPLDYLRIRNKDKVSLQTSLYKEYLVCSDKYPEITKDTPFKLQGFDWDGYVWTLVELETIDVQPILEIRKQELEKARLVKNMF